jgi:hypothetical protein
MIHMGLPILTLRQTFGLLTFGSLRPATIHPQSTNKLSTFNYIYVISSPTVASKYLVDVMTKFCYLSVQNEAVIGQR